MRMKQITAGTIQEALAFARKELGEHAVLLDSKKADKGKGIVVTFAVEEEDDILPLHDVYTPAAPVRAEAPVAPEKPSAEPEHPALTMIAEVLRYHAIPLAFADRLLARVQQLRLKPGHVLDVAESALADALASMLVFKPLITTDTMPERAIMLVGPHGAGKTSSIGKLATELTLKKKPVVLISADMERLGGTDSVRQLAAILKCPFHIADSRATLKSLLAQYQGKAWTLIDSSGANIYEFAPLKALGELAGLQGIEPILTTPAGMDSDEAQEMASVFSFLNIERMIVTRFDAVRRLGSLFAAQSTGGYALSNHSDSAILTDICRPLSATDLAHFMLRHVRERTSH